jgi:hypothetical protein
MIFNRDVKKAEFLILFFFHQRATHLKIKGDSGW